MTKVSINSYSDRRRVREELERQGIDGERVDVGVTCRCPLCNQVHYKRKEVAEVVGKAEAREEVENADM
jgi:hypothetical protein